jgi:anti-sigma B factor antagonist
VPVGELKASVTTAPASSVVIVLDGGLDVWTAPFLVDLLGAALRMDVPSVVLDMGRVDFIDEEGLGALLYADDETARAGVSLMLRSPSKRVLDMLMLNNLDGRFTYDMAYLVVGSSSATAPASRPTLGPFEQSRNPRRELAGDRGSSSL